jgi:hypothetical protein
MPLYLISHAIPLSSSQQDTLAAGITKTHTTLFTTPSLFVNVRFNPADQHVGYVGGKKTQTNSISAHVRHGPARGKEMYNKLVHNIAELWEDVVCFPHFLFCIHSPFFFCCAGNEDMLTTTNE